MNTLTLSDIATEIIVDERKLTDYALNPAAPKGKDKARVFDQVLGFSIQNYQELMHQLESKCPGSEVVLHGEDSFGQRYQVDVEIIGANGRKATVRTG